jgi:pSer/pThr/pTyr-binding forkhead associated (FHA) protein
VRQGSDKQGYPGTLPAPAEVGRAAPEGLRPGPGGDVIVGAPVLDIATTRNAPVRLVECARCHGHCIAGTRFCKYCGAPLESDRMTPVPVDVDRAAEGGRPAGEAPTRADLRSGGEVAALEGRPTLPETRAPARRDHASTLSSSVEGPGGAARATTASHTPLRSPYSVRSAAPYPDVRARVPEGQLVVIVEDGSEGKTFPMSGRQIDVGRTEGDILLEEDLYVSPRHARLVPQEGGWLLRDLGSVNRIYLRIRKPHTLRDADLLLLGLEVLQFQTVSDGERGLGHAIQHGTLLFGSPAMHRRARLCQKTVEGVTRDVYHLYREETVIGRETGDIVFTSDPFLSRRHAVIRRSPATGEFTVADLDSSNGTYVAIREDVSLVNGDFVRIGQHLFRVDLS